MSSAATSHDTTLVALRAGGCRARRRRRGPWRARPSSLKRMVMPLRRHHEEVVVARRRHDPDQLVAVAQVDGDEALAPRLVVLAERRLLHLALRGGEDQVLVGREVAGGDDGLDRLVRRQRHQVDGGGAPGRALLHRDLVAPQPVDLAPVGEQQQVGVGGGVDHLADQVLLLQPGALDAPAAPALGPEGGGRHRLDVAGPRHGDDDLLVVDQVLDAHLAGVVGDRCCAAGWRTCRGSPSSRSR